MTKDTGLTLLRPFLPPNKKQTPNTSSSEATAYTWLASSRVGDIIRALNPLFVGCFRCIKMGMLKAKVFPDPVGAEARSSRP